MHYKTPTEAFYNRLDQLLINKNNDNLISISILQEKANNYNSLWSNMDLSKEECRDQLTTFIKTNKINFMILDNLGCLVPQNLNTDKLPQDIFNWLHQITGKCSVLLIHHTKQDGSKVRGSQLWSNKAPNEIQLINVRNDQRSRKRYKTISNDYLPQTKQAFCGVRFNKTKSYPVLQNQIFWITLPLNQPKWTLVATTDLDGKILEESLPAYDFPDLDKRENLILSKTKETFTAKDAEDIIKKKRGTVLKCLKNLQDKGYIKKEGTIKSTYYTKTTNNDTTSKENQKHIEITKNSNIPPLLTNKNVQIQEDKQTHTNDKKDLNETESGVIIRRRNSNLTQPNENETNKKSLSDK